jgi:hypothetical protein
MGRVERAKGAQKEMGTDAVKLFQKEPKEIIQLALTKYNKDYQKAYNYLKTISQYDLADHEDEMDNATETLQMMRNAIMKVFHFDPDVANREDDKDTTKLVGQSPEKIAKIYIKAHSFYNKPDYDASKEALEKRHEKALRSGEIKKDDATDKNVQKVLDYFEQQSNKGGPSVNLDGEPAASGATEKVPFEKIKGKTWEVMAKTLLNAYGKDFDSAYEDVIGKIKTNLKNGGIEKGDKNYTALVKAGRAIKNKVDEENARLGLSAEKGGPKKEEPKTPEQAAAPPPEAESEAAQIQKSITTILDKLKNSPEYAGREPLLATRTKAINALPPEKKKEMIKAINANPKNLVGIVTGFVKQKPGQ